MNMVSIDVTVEEQAPPSFGRKNLNWMIRVPKNSHLYDELRWYEGNKMLNKNNTAVNQWLLQQGITLPTDRIPYVCCNKKRIKHGIFHISFFIMIE